MTKFLSLGAPVVTSLLLAACSFVPAYERPAAPVATAYPGAGATSATTPAADIAWQDYFVDARLRKLIELSLANNRDLRVAVLNIDRAQAQYRVQRAAQFPAINGAFAGQRQSGSSDVYTLGVGITSFELDFFGRVQSLKDAALAQYLATAESRKTVQINLVASVANTYLGILADEELLRLTRETLATREQSLKLAQLRFDNGVSSELDLRQAQGLVEGARAAAAQLQRQRALDENALVLLLGQPLPVDLPAGQDFRLQVALLADVPAGLPSELLVKRPDIRSAEQLLLAANASIGSARAAFFPRISLTTSVGKVSGDLDNLLSGGTGWTFAPQLLLPLFNAGANEANLESAKLGRDIAVAQYEKAIQTAFREVADSLAGRDTLLAQYKATQSQVDAAAATFKLSELRYNNGVASYLDLLDAQRSLFTAQQAAVQVRLAHLQNQVTLYKVLGGGWKD
ncbi:MAG TPA: efflux transporter outer membrane subunit [Casimicrobium huifangae]|nr:efflux transporter outer membrane subunit [Casimicrobium huifangae]HQA34670.1 efflux transporter outer membrane subunit [Casimicrobium huifangae]